MLIGHLYFVIRCGSKYGHVSLKEIGQRVQNVLTILRLIVDLIEGGGVGIINVKENLHFEMNKIFI